MATAVTRSVHSTQGFQASPSWSRELSSVCAARSFASVVFGLRRYFPYVDLDALLAQSASPSTHLALDEAADEPDGRTPLLVDPLAPRVPTGDSDESDNEEEKYDEKFFDDFMGCDETYDSLCVGDMVAPCSKSFEFVPVPCVAIWSSLALTQSRACCCVCLHMRCCVCACACVCVVWFGFTARAVKPNCKGAAVE